MLAYALRRLAMLPLTLLGVALLAFALVHLVPGDPVLIMLGERSIDPAQRAELLHNLGLDLPLPRQFIAYLIKLVHGDLGVSIFSHQSVTDEFLQRFPATFELSLLAMLLALGLGLPAGVLAAVRRGRSTDHLVMAASLTGYSMPVFWWGMLLILLFSVHLGWTPVSGRLGAEYWVEPRSGLMLIDAWLAGDAAAWRDALRHLLLPSVVLGTIPLAMIARMTRSALLEVLGEDYVRTARAKGVASHRVVLVHALRNAMIPVLTVAGLQVGVLLVGAILTETVFAWPGIGQWLVQAIYQRDYPVVQGGILLISCLIIALNQLVDFGYGLLDPRIRHASA